MGEYQLYEFQAIDRPLTEEEQEAVSSLSSRVEPHPWRARFVYHYSGFHGEPVKVLARYYDAMLYMANWGSRQLVFRSSPRVTCAGGSPRCPCRKRTNSRCG